MTDVRWKRAIVHNALLDFNWSNYGLDEVEEARSDDWAAGLAVLIVGRLYPEGPDA